MSTDRLLSILFPYLLSTFLWIGTPCHSYAQCRYISTNEKLDATCPEQIVECKDYLAENVSLSFALRQNKTGYLIMSHNPILGSSFHIGKYFGDSYLVLDDESIIKLVHRGNEWAVNEEYFVRYNLTAGEIQQLAKINIRSIRYIIASNRNSSTELSNRDCTKWSKFSDELIIPRIDFPLLISKLIK